MYFHEVQRFRDSWLWLVIILVPTAGLVAALALPGRSTAALVASAVALVALAWIVAAARLETTLDARELRIAFHGIWPTRHVALERIAGYEACRYTIFDSGGWGVHLGLKGMTYNVSGNDGIALRLRDGARVLLGTRRPEELVAALDLALRERGASSR